MPRAQRSGQGYRRTKLTAAGVAAALAAVMFIGTGTGGAAPESPSAPAQTTVSTGAASATAYSYKVNPRAGQLSVAIGFGVSLANYQNQVGIAESRAIDLGIIGALLAAPSCKEGGDPTLPKEQQPQAVHVEARGAPASADGDEAGVMTKHAEATPDPFARAVTTTAARDIIPGVLSLGPTRSETITRYVNGTREAIAISEVASLDVLNGLVSLSGLRWEAIHRTGAVTESIGTFTIGGGQASGIDLTGLLGPVLKPGGPLPLDPTTLVNTIGETLRTLGINLQMPQAFQAGGSQFVSPLMIGIVPNTLRDSLLNGLLTLLRPIREPVVKFLFDTDCRTEDVITVADIAVGTITGSGDFNAELGGVQASSRELAQTCFFCATGGGVTGPVVLPGTLGTGGTPGTPGNPAIPPSAAPAASTAAPTAPSGPTSNERARKAEPISADGKRGGAMALVGAIGLGLLAAAAEGDRRKMRRAQRMIPVEALSHG